MKTQQQAFGWVAWGIAIGFLFSGILFFAWQVSTEPWCKADEPDCFREWVSALGGWAAVIAASVGLIYASGQVKIARNQAQDSFRLQLHRMIALTKAANAAGQELASISEISRPGSVGLWEFEWLALPRTISELETAANQTVLQRFEEEIEFPSPFSQAFVRERFREFHRDYGDVLKLDRPHPDTRERAFARVADLCDYCFDYGQACERITDRFLASSSEIIARYD